MIRKVGDELSLLNIFLSKIAELDPDMILVFFNLKFIMVVEIEMAHTKPHFSPTYIPGFLLSLSFLQTCGQL